jgi:hypothetical protein
LSLLSYPYPYFIFYLTDYDFLLFYQYILFLLIICCLIIYLLALLKECIQKNITKYFQNNKSQYIVIPIDTNINYGTYYTNSSGNHKRITINI